LEFRGTAGEQLSLRVFPEELKPQDAGNGSQSWLPKWMTVCTSARGSKGQGSKLVWEPEQGRLTLRQGYTLQADLLAVYSSGDEDPFVVYFHGVVGYRAPDGEEKMNEDLANGVRQVQAEKKLMDHRSVCVWNIRVPGMEVYQIPASRPPFAGNSRVVLLRDEALAEKIRTLNLDSYLMFGCEKEHLVSAYDEQQAPLCELVRGLVEKNVAQIWPDEDPHNFTIKDSSMFCGGVIEEGSSVPLMHNVRLQAGYAAEVF